jgi:hypothetical protein
MIGSLRKEAAVAESVGSTLGRSLASTLGFMGKHPYMTAGVIGVGALLPSIVNIVKYPYYVHNEEMKKDILRNQTGLLQKLVQHQQPRSEPQPMEFPLL